MAGVESVETHPFLFLGAGFGTSRKCLECQIWFARPPSADERAAIEQLLPPALVHVKSWSSSVLNFGSDDTLEYRISGTRKKPSRDEWEGFCEDVERRALAIHAVCPIAVLVKHDTGDYGRDLGPWHFWSLQHIATRFHELPCAWDTGPELIAVCLSVLTMLGRTRSAAAALDPAARSKLVEWGTKMASLAGKHAGPKIVNATLALVPAGAPLSPELAGALFCHPTKELVERLGGNYLVERGLTLLSTGTPETAEDVLDALLAWLILDDIAGRQIGEALLGAESMKAAVEDRSASVRRGFAARKPTGKSSPGVTFFAQASYLLEMNEPARALTNIELGLRFPHTHLDLHGLHVRALHGVGQTSRAEAIATSDFIQNEAGPESPRIFYELTRYYIAVGKLAEAVAQFRRFLEREPGTAHFIRNDSRLRALHALPEYRALFEGRAGLPQG